MFKTAKWIENVGCPGEWAPLFRKSFEFQKADNVQIAICGLGFYVLEINGQRVSEDLLTPPFTAYDKRVLYQVYDITDYVTEGENTIDVICGNGWYNQQESDAWRFHNASWKAAPKMICQIDVDGVCYLVSDSSWMTTKSRTDFNSHRRGENYRASMELQDFHPASIARGPGGRLEKQTTPPVRLQGIYEGKEISPGLYDFGKSLTGNVEIKVQGCKDDWVSILYTERVRDDGTIDRADIAAYVYDKRFAHDDYFVKEDGKEEIWHGDFSFHGFRYAEVQHAATTKVLSVRARDFHTDIPEAGGYTCDNENVNRLHNACVRALLTNYIHIPMDCPHREKNGWTADAMLSSYQALYNLDIKEAYKKWLDDIVDCQRPNGAIPCIAPTSTWGYNWGTGTTWDATLFVLPWNIYRFTGDFSAVEKNYPAMEKYLAFLETESDNDIFNIGLGDWCAPPEAVSCDNRVLVTCYAKYIFELFAEMSAILGFKEKEVYARKRVVEIKKAFQREFTSQTEESPTYYAAVVYFDIIEEKEQAATELARLVRQADGHLYAGIFGAFLIPIVLRDYGYFELAWEMLCKEKYPGWMYMMNKCHGTMGEDWRGRLSLDHHMFTAVDGFIQESLSGLSIGRAEAGFKKVHLKPYFPKDMTRFTFWHKVEEGTIKVEWNIDFYSVVIPKGIVGTVELCGQIHQLKTGKNVFDLS